jgi:2-polyprenyl-6-methoxyphenol hydroxylase-like FAD-dependent oxidoreductase
LGQFLLEELLEDELRAAGVRVEWGRRLRGIEQGADEVEACVEKLPPIGRGGIIPDFEEDPLDCFQIHADFVVGADGHNSLLRRQLGIGLVRAGSPRMYGVYEIETVEPVDHEMKLVVSDSEISVLWPMTNNRCRWSFQIVPPDALDDSPPNGRGRPILIEPPIEGESLHDLRRFLADRAPWFRHQIKDILWTARAQFDRQFAARFGAGRCWLAGDAAHQAGPAGMQSMNAGLGEAADLADKLESILRNHSKADLMGSYDLLHRQQWERWPGLNGPARQPGGLSPWARGHYSTLTECLPASGEDLNHLLEKL